MTENGNLTQEKTNTALPPVRTVERRIGKATFIVSSRFSEDKEKDIVSTIARLVESDHKQP